MQKHLLVPHHLKRIVVWASIDSLIIVFAYIAAFSVRAATTPLEPFIQSYTFVGFIIVMTLIWLYIFGAYYRIWSRTSGHGISTLINATLVSGLISATINAASIQDHLLPMSVLVLGHSLALVGFVAVRYRSRLISGISWRWRVVWLGQEPPYSRQKVTRVLVVGAGESGQITIWRLKHRFNLKDNQRYQVIGIVDDASDKLGMYVEGCQVLGDRHMIPQLAKEHNIDLIILAVHNIDGANFREILNYCERTSAMIKVVPSMFDLVAAKQGVPLLRDVQPEDYLGRQPIGRHKDVDFGPITNKVVLVTGAAGSIGSELSRQLAGQSPKKLILLDSNESGLHDLIVDLKFSFTDSDESHNIIVPALADITYRPSLEYIFATYRPEVVFHAAAYKHVTMLEMYPSEAVRVNIGGTLNVAELSAAYHAERFVLISTDKAVNPSSVMGASKRLCELLVYALDAQQTLFTAVRFGNVLGSRGSVVPTFNRQIDSGGPVTITDPEMKRYFMSIPEAVNLVLHAACLTKGHDLFMLEMGELVPIVDLAERMIRMRGLRPYADIPIEFVGMRAGEKLYEELQFNGELPHSTIHPKILELIKSQNGLNKTGFLEALRTAKDSKLNDYRDAIWNLIEIFDPVYEEVSS